MGESDQNNLDSEDVTEEFYDLGVRIKNKTVEVESFRALYQKAVKIPDILSIKRELDQAQEALERLQGRQKYLESMANLATITVWLQERGVYVPAESPDFGTSVSRTFANSLAALIQFGRGLALILVALTPWLPVILVVVLPPYFWWRWHKRQRTPPAVITATPLKPTGPVGEV